MILLDADWFWLILIDSDWFWLILIDSDWCWLILIDADWFWHNISSKLESYFLFRLYCNGPIYWDLSHAKCSIKPPLRPRWERPRRSNIDTSNRPTLLGWSGQKALQRGSQQIPPLCDQCDRHHPLSLFHFCFSFHLPSLILDFTLSLSSLSAWVEFQ